MLPPIHLNHIYKVLDSQYSVSQIHRETHVSQSELTELRERKSSPTQIRITNGSKLEMFYLKHRREIDGEVPTKYRRDKSHRKKIISNKRD